MNFRLVEIPNLSGNSCKIYSVILDGDDSTLFSQFCAMNYEQYEDEILDIYNRLNFMGKEGGARPDFFKKNEGALGDSVCALYDTPNSKLRLYCIRYSKIAVVLGGGGFKKTRTWQEDPILCKNAKLMMQLSARIDQAIREKDLKISESGKFIGELYLTDADYENDE